MSDLSNARIKELACLIEYAGTQITDPETVQVYRDIWKALVELNARRILADERKQFWARRAQ